jgi:hypothetical protein
MVNDAKKIVGEARRERKIERYRQQADSWYGPSGNTKPKVTLT